MNEPWRIALGVVFVAVLAAGLLWVVVSDDGPASASNVSPLQATATAAPTGTAAPSTAPPAAPSSPAAATTAPAATTTTVTEEPPAGVAIGDVLAALRRAFDDWGEFAVTGDLALVSESFDIAGPQYAILVEEAPTLAADPLGPPPYVFTAGELELERPRPQRVVLVGPVILTRPGEPDQQFQWRIHLRWSGTDWRLWTVEEIGDAAQ